MQPGAFETAGMGGFIGEIGDAMSDSWGRKMIELAKTCGLNAADSRLTTLPGCDVPLGRRFERDRTDGGYWHFGMISAVTPLHTDGDATARTDRF